MTANSKPNSKNIQYLRKINRAKILENIALGKADTRVALAKNLSLTKMAISKIISSLMEDGLIVEDAEETAYSQKSANSGRKPTRLKIPKFTINAIGVFIDRSFVQTIAMDINGIAMDMTSTVLEKDCNSENLMKIVFKQIQHVLKNCEGKRFYGIGIACIGPLNINEGKLMYPPNFYGINNLNLVQLVQEKFNMPTYIDNDMNLAALAELFYGNGREYNNISYLGFGSGVGSGIIENRYIIHGSKGFACEIGHVSMNFYDGNVCACGQAGCLELYSNTKFLLESSSCDSLADLKSLALGNVEDIDVKNTIIRFKDAILFAMISVSNMFDSDIILLGGENLCLLRDYDIEELSLRLNRRIFTKRSKHMVVKKSSFEGKTPLIGSAALVFRMIMNGSLDI